MPFEYSCFISYRRDPYKLPTQFIEQLEDALNNYVHPLIRLKAFRDTALAPGDLLDQQLACRLCKSVCLILVFTPPYFDPEQLWCAREYYAMERLERERLELLGDELRGAGLIIPIVLKRPDRVPAAVKKDRLFCDFSSYTLQENAAIGENPKYVAWIEKVANRIFDLYEEFKLAGDPCGGCSGWELPPEEEVKQWITALLPQRQPRQSRSLPFREEGR